MTTLSIEVPDKVLDELKKTPQEAEQEVRLAAAIEWFRRGLISQGRAAELAGMPRASFLDELASRKVDVFAVDLEGLKAELKLA